MNKWIASIYTRLFKVQPQPLLIDLCKDLLQAREKDIFRQEIKLSTYTLYVRKVGTITQYLKVKKCLNIKACDVDETFAETLLDDFLRRGLTKNYSNSIVEWIKNSLELGVRNHKLKFNKLHNLELKFKVTRKLDKLKPDQFETFKKFPFKKKMERYCQDLQILQSLEGMPFADLFKFHQDNFSTEKFIVNGSVKEIELFRYIKQKSRVAKPGVEVIVEVFPEAKAILAKHHGKLEPITYRQYEYNLKNMGEQMGLPFVFTTHVGRRTFAQLMSNKGYSHEALGVSMGHSDTHTTQIYAQPGLERLMQERANIQESILYQ